MIGSHTATTRSYLSQFARVQSPSDRKAKLWVYERGARPFSATPYRVGKENGYFAVTKADGGRDESMEATLAALESRGAALLPLLNYETYVISPQDEDDLSGYIALTFARTTARRSLGAMILGHIREAYKELASDPEWLQEQASAYEAFSGVATSLEGISTAASKVLAKLSKPEFVNNAFVQGLLQVADAIRADLKDKPWQIWEAPGQAQFVTTDNPLITLKREMQGFLPGCGFGTPGVTSVFAISPSCCFVTGGGIGPGRRYWRRATSKDVNSVNRALVMCMDRWAYSATPSEDIEWLVNRFGGIVKYGVNAFVPTWMNNASEHIKAKIRGVIAPHLAKIGPRSASWPAGAEMKLDSSAQKAT